MFFLCLLLVSSTSEWIGELNLPEFNTKYLILNRLDVSEPFRMKGYLCENLNCTFPKILLHFNQSLSSIRHQIFEHSPQASILFSNTSMSWFFTTPCFQISEAYYPEISKYLLTHNTVLGEIFYSFECNFHLDHCENSVILISTCIIFSSFWLIFTILWILNTYSINARYSMYFHKVSSTVLVFKVLTVISTLWYWSTCPYNSSLAQLVGLLRAQCMSLYDTSLLSFQLFVSQGVYLHENISRQAVSYSLMLIVLTYILACGGNLMGTKFHTISLIMTLLIFANVLYFSLVNLKKIIQQRAAVFLTGHTLLASTISSRLVLISIVFFLQVLYFTGQVLAHILFADTSLRILSKESIIDYEAAFTTELIEACILFALFTILRSKPVGQFYYSEINFERLVPFYHSDSNYYSDGIALIMFPRKNISIGVPFSSS